MIEFGDVSNLKYENNYSILNGFIYDTFIVIKFLDFMNDHNFDANDEINWVLSEVYRP